MPAAWSKYEEDYLQEKWGAVSIATIAKNLGRSVYGVKLKAQRLGLKRFIHSGEHITLSQLCQVLKISYSTWSMGKYKKLNMPVKRKKVINESVRILYMRDFWKWAEQHKMAVDFSRFEPGELGPEPMWVQDKRKADMEAKKYKRRDPWTPEEDWLLTQMLNSYRYTCREMSIRLKRTEGAVARRYNDLGLKQRPLVESKHTNHWTADQVELLTELYYMGYIAEVMAEHIPKSAKAIQGKTERLVKEGKLHPTRYRPLESDEGSGFGYQFKNAGVHYKKALPPEKWAEAERFLGILSGCFKESHKRGAEPDVGAFIEEYRRAGVGE